MAALLSKRCISSFILVFCTLTLTHLPLYSAPPPQGGVTSKIPQKTGPAEEEKKKKAAEERAKKRDAIQKAFKEKFSQRQKKDDEASYIEGKEYLYPGLILREDSGWEGSDNVFNLSRNIAVGVDIDLPPLEAGDAPFPIKVEAIRERVKKIFTNAGITPYPKGEGSGPPLPLFRVLIIAQPIAKGYVFYCSGNLLEEIDIKRVIMKEGVWQAITWERQHLVVSAAEEITYQVERCVDDLAYNFVKLYRHFENIRPQR